jgi:hypothetical protein
LSRCDKLPFVFFVLEDVAAVQLTQEALDGVTAGIQLFTGIVILFILGAPESSCFEALIQDGFQSKPELAVCRYAVSIGL